MTDDEAGHKSLLTDEVDVDNDVSGDVTVMSSQMGKS